MIYDCFPFFNELEVLEIRLNELHSVVDKFVIVEGTQTHSKKPKPLYFEENKAMFSKFADQIIHVIVDDFPDGDSWANERHQRDTIQKNLLHCDDNDIIIITDADEIPKADAVRNYSASQGLCELTMKLHYYFFNCRMKEDWTWARILPYSMFKNMTPCQIRYIKEFYPIPAIPDAGWHFSFLGSAEKIIEKIESTAHVEYDRQELKDYSNVIDAMSNGKDVLGRSGVEFSFENIDITYPRYILENFNKFKHLMKIRNS